MTVTNGRILTMTKLNGFTNAEEMESFIVSEVQKASKRKTIGTRNDSSDLESYLMIRVWNFVMNNPKYQTQKGVRQVINSRVTNFFNSSNNSDDLTFSALTSSDDEGSETDFESTFVTGETTIDTTVVESELLNGFLNTLTDRQRLIVELRAGILESLNAEQYAIASAIMTKQSAKVAGEVYLSNSDIAKIVGIHRNHITKNLNAISEKALDFGLEELA